MSGGAATPPEAPEQTNAEARELVELAAAAEAEMPSPWWFDGRDILHHGKDTHVIRVVIPIDKTWAPAAEIPDAVLRYIAAANPAALAALVARADTDYSAYQEEFRLRVRAEAERDSARDALRLQTQFADAASERAERAEEALREIAEGRIPWRPYATPVAPKSAEYVEQPSPAEHARAALAGGGDTQS